MNGIIRKIASWEQFFMHIGYKIIQYIYIQCMNVMKKCKKILTAYAQYDIISLTYMSEKTIACVRNSGCRCLHLMLTS